MLITAGIIANQCVVGALFRRNKSEKAANLANSCSKLDNKFHTFKDRTPEENDISKEMQVTGDKISSKNLNRCYASIKDERLTVTVKDRIIGWVKQLKKSNTVTLLRNVRLQSFSISTFLRGFAYVSAMVHFVALCVDNGISKTDAAFLLSLMGIGSFTAPLSQGIFIDRKLITPLNLQSLALITAGISCVLVAIHPIFVTLVAFVVIFGVSSGIFNATVPSAIRQILDIHQVKGGIGITLMVESIGGLLGVPLIGKY